MATFERHVDVEWSGSVMDGKGEAKAGTGAFTLPVTFPSRIGEPGGRVWNGGPCRAVHAHLASSLSRHRFPKRPGTSPR